MQSALFKELKRMGMDEDIALEFVSRELPQNLATREDILVLQESILQVKLDTERGIAALREEMHAGHNKLQADILTLRKKIHAGRNKLKADYQPRLGDDAESFAEDAKMARSNDPLQDSSWD